MATEEFLLTHLLPFESVFFFWFFVRFFFFVGGGGGGGMCIWDTVMAELDMEISNNDFRFMGIKSRNNWGK